MRLHRPVADDRERAEAEQHERGPDQLALRRHTAATAPAGRACATAAGRAAAPSPAACGLLHHPGANFGKSRPDTPPARAAARSASAPAAYSPPAAPAGPARRRCRRSGNPPASRRGIRAPGTPPPPCPARAGGASGWIEPARRGASRRRRISIRSRRRRWLGDDLGDRERRSPITPTVSSRPGMNSSTIAAARSASPPPLRPGGCRPRAGSRRPPRSPRSPA